MKPTDLDTLIRGAIINDLIEKLPLDEDRLVPEDLEDLILQARVELQKTTISCIVDYMEKCISAMPPEYEASGAVMRRQFSKWCSEMTQDMPRSDSEAGGSL